LALRLLSATKTGSSGLYVKAGGQFQPKLRKHQKLLFHSWIRLGIGVPSAFRRLSEALTDLLSTIVHEY
jgi:hypothetical protein